MFKFLVLKQMTHLHFQQIQVSIFSTCLQDAFRHCLQYGQRASYRNILRVAIECIPICAENYCFQPVSRKYLAITFETSHVEFISEASVYAVHVLLLYPFADTRGLTDLDFSLSTTLTSSLLSLLRAFSQNPFETKYVGQECLRIHVAKQSTVAIQTEISA